jgi:hypothetical protein
VHELRSTTVDRIFREENFLDVGQAFLPVIERESANILLANIAERAGARYDRQECLSYID